MERSVAAGIVLGILIIGVAIFLGPSKAAFWNFPALLIIGGGIFASTLIRFPFRVIVETGQVTRSALAGQPASPLSLVYRLSDLALLVRRESLLAMEKAPVSDPFLRRGIELCVDGLDPATIDSVLRSEVATALESLDRGQRLLRTIGTSCPAFGMIGTLIGLVQMLTRIDDPSRIGGAMAVALLTTFYGAFLAYLLFLPLADRLAERGRREIVNREIVIQGLLAILAGHHPRLVERRLLGLIESAAGERPRPRRRRAPAA